MNITEVSKQSPTLYQTERKVTDEEHKSTPLRTGLMINRILALQTNLC